jgi:hypothetical protein
MPERVLRTDLSPEDLEFLLKLRRLRWPLFFAAVGFLIFLLSPLFMGGY